jgi:hypothetical protein
LCRNCLLEQVIEGKIKGGIEVTGRRERWRRKLLDDAVVEALRYKPEGRGIDSRWCHWNSSLT